jgi:catechol 2,3-dioxygenase-like lactoylglutathione lyase family enzyme
MITGLDHTGLAVADLEPARALFEGLGFTLSPREALTRPGPDGRHVASGADNHVFMLERGYQELISVTDPASGHMLIPRLARYHGLHIIVLASADVDALHARLTAQGVPAGPCMTWGRRVEGGGEARFRFFMYDPAEAPEAVLCVVQHLTPDLLRPPALMRHANGAQAIAGVTLHVADRAEAAARYARLLDMQPEGDTFRFADGTRLRLADSGALAQSFPGASVPPAPSVAAVEFVIGNPDVPARAGVPLHPDDGGAWIGPDDAFGAVIRFVPAP